MNFAYCQTKTLYYIIDFILLLSIKLKEQSPILYNYMYSTILFLKHKKNKNALRNAINMI